MAIGSLGTVVYDILAQDKTKAGLDSATSRADKLRDSMRKVGAVMTGVGVASKVMADNVNASFLPFDTAMAQVKSLGGVTDEQMDIMRDAAIEMSTQLPISAEEVAQGFYSMRSAGFDAAQVIAELPAIANMAVAGNLDMAKAVDATTMVLDTYGTAAGSAEDITNVLVGTVQGFKTTLPELQQQLSKSIGVASTLGISFGELAAMSGALKKDFTSAEEAGTAMKTMLMRLVDPNVQAQLEELGVNTKDVNGNFVGMESILTDLSSVMDDAGGNVEQMATLQKLFGAEGVRAAMSLVRQKDEMEGYTEAVTSGTSVQEALTAQLDSTSSQLEIAQNKMDAAKISLGEGMAPATILVADAMGGFADVLSGLPEPLQATVGMGIQFSQVFMGLGPLLMGLSAINFGAVIPSLTGVAAGVWAVIAPLAPIIIGIGAVIAILYILEKKFGLVTKAVDFATSALEKISEIVSTKFQEAADAASTRLGEMENFVTERFESIKTIITSVLDIIKGIVTLDFTLMKDSVGTLLGEMLGLVTLNYDLMDVVTGGKLTEMKDKVFNFYSEMFTIVSEKLTEMWTAVSTKYDEMWTTVSTKLTEMWELVSTKYEEMATLVSEKLTEMYNILSEKYNEMLTFVTDTLVSMYTTVSTKYLEMYTYIYDTLVDILDIIVGFWTDIYNAVKDFLVDIYDTVKNKFDEMYDTIDTTMADIKTTIDDTWDTIKSKIKEKITEIYDTVKIEFTNTLNWIKGQADSWYNAGIGLVQSAINGLVNGFKKLLKTVNKYLRKLRKKLPFSPAKEGPLSQPVNWEGYLVDPLDRVPKAMDRKLANVLTGMRSNIANNSFSVNLTINSGAITGRGDEQMLSERVLTALRATRSGI